MSTLRSETPAATAVASACPLDCPDACSLEVRVQEGRVVSIGGSRANPLTDGYICAKVRRFPEHVHGPDRVLYPQIRVGRRGRGASAARAGTRRFLASRSGCGDLVDKGQADAILPLSYGGSNGYLSQDTTDARLFSRLGASRLARTVCSAPSGRAATGLYGKMAGIALQDYAHAKLIVLWGVNPSASGIHILPHVQDARKRGARVVVIDPRRTRVAAGSDLHLAVKPGHGPAGRARADPVPLRHGSRRPDLPRRARDGSAGAAPPRVRLDDRVGGDGGGDRSAGPRDARRLVRRIEPRGDPLRLGARAQPQRRLGRGGDPGASRRRRESSACAAAATRCRTPRSGISTPGAAPRRRRRRRARST